MITEYSDPLKIVLLKEKRQRGCWACRWHQRKKKILQANEPKFACVHSVEGYPFLGEGECDEFKRKAAP